MTHSVVHLHDLLALLSVGLHDCFLEACDCLINGNYAGQLEEDRLHDHVDPSAEANLTSQLYGVDRVELEMLLGDRALEGSGDIRL